MNLIIIVVILLGIIGCVLAYRKDKRDWNNGICPKCGTPWRQFDTDSQGGRGYNCEMRCNSIWISWLNEREINRPTRGEEGG